MLTSSQRADFLSLLNHLGPGNDPQPAVRFAHAHGADLLEELTALSTSEQLRAGVLRLLRHWAPEGADLTPLRRRAGEALLVPVDGPTASLRHPAWIGLAVLELADSSPDWTDDPVERALELAGRAFECTDPGSAGPGEILWAMAEEAESVGWLTRSDALYELALEADCAHEEHRAQLLLLMALRRLEREEPGAEALLESLRTVPGAPPQARVHGLWLLAQRQLETGAQDPARVLLLEARELLRTLEHPQVLERVEAALSELGVFPTSAPGQG